MKKETYIASTNIISPLGFTSAENFRSLSDMKTGVRIINNPALFHEPVCAAAIDEEKINTAFNSLGVKESYTKLEKLIILSVSDAIKQNSKINTGSEKTLFILSTTKGNIDLLAKGNQSGFDNDRKFLWQTGKVIAGYFNNPNKPVVVSNACISGVMAIILGKRILEGGTYDTIIVTGADLLTEFVISGFESFKAISKDVCKPYDASRDGISLGEGCGTMILTNRTDLLDKGISLTVQGGSNSNDANHISGPSRTGDGLLLTIINTLKEAGLSPSDVDYISGHGTATLFNDEMESLAMADAHLSHVPINSLKSYFGHTLGAAGIIESIIALESMKSNTLIGTYNYKEPGVSMPLNVIRQTTAANIDICLKTASGFGGCNASVLFQKKSA